MLPNPVTRGKQRKDLTGTRFGRLRVIGEGLHKYYGNARVLYWKCQCDCGTVKDVAGTSLKTGCSTSCGCYYLEMRHTINFKHGVRRTRAYSAWCNMRNRCYREKDDYFHCYGGRGIKVCDSWHDFINFYKDMGEPPKGMCLDRKDNDGDYSPDNCHWTTQKVQQRNRRNNHMLSFNGETLCVAEWSDRTGINRRTIEERSKKGWPIEKILSRQLFR